MLKLQANTIAHNPVLENDVLLTLSKNSNMPYVLREKMAYFLPDEENIPKGFSAYLTYSEDIFKAANRLSNLFLLPADLSYLAEGDIVRITTNGKVHSLFRKNSNHNTMLLTERCNHYCLMCSQPPKEVNDDWLMDEALELMELIPRETQNIGFSGGEPTLYGDRFIELIQKAKLFLPNTAIDVLSNGRAFKDVSFVNKLASINHSDLVLGIPIYSDDPERHNFIVQSQNAFDETIQGIINLKKYRQKVEIRVVLHKQSIDRLPNLCEYITRNLVFVDHVALMGLEMTGFTRANLDQLWIDPIEYKDTLSEAVTMLNAYGIRNSVYNHQLCVINEDVRSNYVKSISDWKNEYVKECDGCTQKNSCGGFFSSSKQYRYSDYITPYS